MRRFWGGNIRWMSSGDVHAKRIKEVEGRITEAGLRNSNAVLVTPPTVAIALAGQGKTRGTAALTLVPTCTNQSVALIRGDGKRLVTEYLFHNLDFRYEELRSRSAGGGRAGLSKGILERIPVPLPDADEQRCLVTVLDAIDQTIERTDALIGKLGMLQAGVLGDLMTRGLGDDESLRAKKSVPRELQDAGIEAVPDGWHVVPLGQCLLRSEYGISTSLAKQGRMPVLRMNNLRDGGISLDDVSYATAPVSSGLLLRPRDVLFNRTNSMEHVGKTSIWSGQLEVATFASYLVRLVPDERVLLPEMLNLWLNWPATQRRIRRYATAAVQQVNINPTNLAKTLIALPQNTDEQQAIADRMAGLQARIDSEKYLRRKLAMIRQGLKHDLLKGVTRMPAELVQEIGTASSARRGANIYFKRAVLAAEIVDQLHGENTFGRVKLMKTLYLAEQLGELELDGHYIRAAAGPFDNKMIRSVESQLKKQKWFDRVGRESKTPGGKPLGWCYVAMEKHGGHRDWFKKYWESGRDRIQAVVDLLRPLDSKRCEILATLYEAWRALTHEGRNATDAAIVDEVLEHWHESKQKVPRERWLKALGWMREQGLLPATGS